MTSSKGLRSVVRRVVAMSSVAAALGVLALPVASASADPAHNPAYTFRGKQVFPEGLTADEHYVYSTSFADGTVYRGKVGGDELKPFLPAGKDGRTSAAGIRKAGHRLLVAGGMTGRFFVYTDTGKLVSSYTVARPHQPTLVNDAAVAKNGDVYITDSYRPVVYRIPAAQVNAAPPAHAPGARPLKVAYRLPDYVDGVSNGNGIAATPDGRLLILGYYQSGVLCRLSLKTGDIRKIATDSALTEADGMLLRGHTLYLIRSEHNLVVTAHLSLNHQRLNVLSSRTYRGADTPTALTISRGRLLVTNSQFDTYLFNAPQTSKTFTIASLPLK